MIMSNILLKCSQMHLLNRFKHLAVVAAAIPKVIIPKTMTKKIMTLDTTNGARRKSLQ